MAEAPRLRQTLYGFQIFFIVISAVIGGGIFNNNGEALEIAGPAGLILSVVVIGIIAISVSECVGEFSQQFPAPNAIVEYVRTFVDEDLSWVVGIAYWYAFASVFALENLSAAGLSSYWGLSQTFQTLAFYVASPVLVLALNFFGVFWYGIVETVGGALKVALILGVSILLYIIAGKEGDGSVRGPINDGFQNDPNFTTDSGRAVCYAIPLVAFSFYGVESIAVTAFEAKYSTSLKWPSRIIAYAVFIFYFLCTIGEALTVRWSATYLPPIFGVSRSGIAGVDPPRSSNWVVNVTLAAGYIDLASFLNGCFMFSVLSTSNTALYIASRTLYGLAREIPDSNRPGRILNRLSLVVRRTGVPAAALVFTSVSFFWLPFLQLKRGYEIQDLIEIISDSGSFACLIVWFSLCLSFIRYDRWLDICDDGLRRRYPHYQRHSIKYKPYTFFAWFQPWTAWIGLLGCTLVFILSSATWWNTPATFTKVAVAYGAHIILLVMFIVLKIISKKWWVRLDPDVVVLVGALDRLKWLKQDEEPEPTELVPQTNGNHESHDVSNTTGRSSL